MSTKGAMGVKINKEYKVWYTHWNSYPDGLGREMVDFCKKVQKDTEGAIGKDRKTRRNTGWNLFKRRCKQLKMVDKDSTPSKYFQKKYSKFFDNNVSSQSKTEWYCLLRELQYVEGLYAIYKNTTKRMIEGFDFLKNSVFCEYAYIINLDEMTLEFYKGFNETFDGNSPLPFTEKDKLLPSYDGGNTYYSVRYKGSVSLTNIPDNWMEQFYPEEVEVET